MENFVLVKFEKDSMVEPRISEWFGFYKRGQAIKTETLHESQLYAEVFSNSIRQYLTLLRMFVLSNFIRKFIF